MSLAEQVLEKIEKGVINPTDEVSFLLLIFFFKIGIKVGKNAPSGIGAGGSGGTGLRGGGNGEGNGSKCC